MMIDGKLRNNNYYITVNENVMSDKLIGYRLSDSLVEMLVDNDVENIVLIDKDRGRYTISLEDWLEHRVWSSVDQWQHVAQSRMSRG